MIRQAPRDLPVTTPQPDSEDELLDEGLEETFPASDPPTSAQRKPFWDQHPETD